MGKQRSVDFTNVVPYLTHHSGRKLKYGPTLDFGVFKDADQWNAWTELPFPGYPKGHSNLRYSEGNPYKQLGKTNRRIGGNFNVGHWELVKIKPTPFLELIQAPNFSGVSYSGYFWPMAEKLDSIRFDPVTGHAQPDSQWPTQMGASNEELDAYGTTMIARVEPTNPLSGLTVALAELKREGLPTVPGIQLWKDKASLAKKAGGEYLNKEFGWDPVISDIRKTINVTRNAEKLIEQYSNGSGRKIHRETQPVTETTTTTTSGTGWEYLYPNRFLWNSRGQRVALDWVMNSPPTWTRTDTIEKTRWFSGCFTYHLPPHKPGGNNLDRQRRLAYKLYGVGITPEIVWDLTPWSWAVDWVSNAGDVFHNIGAFADNGLVMLYGYVMEQIVHTRTISVDIHPKMYGTTLGTGNRAHTMVGTWRNTNKTRRVATPYGFGLDFNGFNPFQLSILTALGLSRRG